MKSSKKFDQIVIMDVCGVRSNACDPCQQFVTVRTRVGDYKKCDD